MGAVQIYPIIFPGPQSELAMFYEICSLPLTLKLIFSKAIQWLRSFTHCK